MSNQMVECGSYKTARKLMPWAAVIARVVGGYMGFASEEEYRTWRNPVREAGPRPNIAPSCVGCDSRTRSWRGLAKGRATGGSTSALTGTGRGTSGRGLSALRMERA